MFRQPLIFIHVPKTAGTSFRQGAEQLFGAGKICCDYGPKAAETSSEVREWMLEKHDPWYFKKAFDAGSYCFFSGHVQASQYAPIFGMECMVTFLRDPLQRLISEYNHFVRHHDYTQSFETFYRSQQFINRQTRMFLGVPWPALGFIGITEQYDLSLGLLNNKFDVDISRLEVNVGNSKVAKRHKLRIEKLRVDKLSTEQEQELSKLNAGEIILYKRACRQLDWRKKIFDYEQVFSRGMIEGINGDLLTGWAVYDHGDEPVRLQIAVNGKQAGEAVASDYRPNLRALGLRRGGFIGYSMKIPPVLAGDEISVTVANTGQPLANSTWRVGGK